jgi:hypothetical protein
MELTIKTEKTEVWEFDYGVLVVREDDKMFKDEYSWDVWIDGDFIESFSTYDNAWEFCCEQKKNNYDRE